MLLPLFKITCHIRNYGPGLVGLSIRFDPGAFSPTLKPVLVLAEHEDIKMKQLSPQRPMLRTFGTEVLVYMPYLYTSMVIETARKMPEARWGYNLSTKELVEVKLWKEN